MSGKAELKYPIFMIHGMGFRDFKHINYWGRIPQALENNGAKVFYGRQDSNGSIESNAEQIKNQLEAVLKETGSEKVNIIAHSKGGLEARYLISSMGFSNRVASLTTISTPHNGSVTIDKLLCIPDFLVKAGCKVCDLWFMLLGDSFPDTYKAINSFRTDKAELFNIENPDSGEVYYQSYAFAMKKMSSDILMWCPYLVVKKFEGENDGLLAPRAVKWTNFRGVYYGSGGRGISHCDEVDMRRYRLSENKDGDISDITEFYVDIAAELKEMGF